MEKKAYEVIKKQDVKNYNIVNHIYDNLSVVIKFHLRKLLAESANYVSEIFQENLKFRSAIDFGWGNCKGSRGGATSRDSEEALGGGKLISSETVILNFLRKTGSN